MLTLIRLNAQPSPSPVRPWIRSLRIAAALTLLLAGCTAPRSAQRIPERPFRFQQDTFAYANELVWEYQLDPATGRMLHHRREKPPDYAQHCFIVAHAARQFFLQARFDPTRPRPDPTTCRRLIHEVISRGSNHASAPEDQVVIPGYPNLYAFSQTEEALLKSECGGAWQSYFQRGHWRMILPLTRGHQERMARQLTDSLRQQRPPVVHLVRFPSLSINHAVLLYDVEESADAIAFSVYDPNSPDHPARLTYQRAQRRFAYPANLYFAGGRVDVYEIYRSMFY